MTQLYVEGALRFSRVGLAGLCTGAGVGLAVVLWRVNPSLEAEPLHHRPDLGLLAPLWAWASKSWWPSSPEYLQSTCTFSSEKRAGAFCFGDKASIL